MADDQQSVAQDDEQDFAIPGQQNDENQPGPSSAPPGASAPVSATPSAAASPSTSDPYYSDPNRAATDDREAPKASGRAMFLGNLLKTILSGAVAGMGQSPTPFGRAVQAGSQAADPMAQQLKKANVEKAMSEADQAKIQTSVTGMKALQTEYMLKRLPQEDQIKHMEVVSKFKDTLIKEGANVEAEADDEKSSDAQAMHLNGTDPRALNHSGHFWSLPTMDAEGKAKFDVVYVPAKDVLQNDFTWKGADGQEHTISAGTPMLGLPKMVEQLQKDVQGDTKEQHKQMGDALKPNVPEGEIPQTVAWLQNQAKQNTPLYQQNKNAVDAQINTLQAAHSQAQADKLAQAHAMNVDKSAEAESRKDANTFGYALDKDGQLAYMSRADANKLHSTFEQMSPGDVNKDRATLRQLNDVQMNVSKYRSATEAMTGNVEHTDAIHRIIAGVSNEDVAKAAFVTLGAAMSMMEQSEVKDSWNKLTDKERKLMIGYLRAKGGIVAYNRALTGSGRQNKEALFIEMANLPTPDVGAKVALPQLDSFQENIDQTSSGLPTNLPGMKTPKQVRTEVWRDSE